MSRQRECWCVILYRDAEGDGHTHTQTHTQKKTHPHQKHTNTNTQNTPHTPTPELVDGPQTYTDAYTNTHTYTDAYTHTHTQTQRNQCCRHTEHAMLTGMAGKALAALGNKVCFHARRRVKSHSAPL